MCVCVRGGGEVRKLLSAPGRREIRLLCDGMRVIRGRSAVVPRGPRVVPGCDDDKLEYYDFVKK